MMPIALIIEDNPTNIIVMSSLLQRMNIDSKIVQDPEKLAETLETMPQVDVVFIDLALPGTDGYQIMHMLRDDYHITAPLVACTVHVNEINNARRQGFHSFLTKPLDPKRFSVNVKNILADQHVWETE